MIKISTHLLCRSYAKTSVSFWFLMFKISGVGLWPQNEAVVRKGHMQHSLVELDSRGGVE